MRLAVRRSLVLGATLALVVASAAVADTISADGDLVASGSQSSVSLGTVAPGATLSLDLGFTLACLNGTHVPAGTTLIVSPMSYTVPGDGSARATAAVLGPVPADWPGGGAWCVAGDGPSLAAGSPSHVVLTAPSTPGAGYQYVLLFSVDPATAVNPYVAATFTIDVLDPAPADTTPPVLAGLPGDIVATGTGSAGVVVDYAPPTATDDSDPAPLVACDPAPGSAFPPGTTTVTCTATDAAGNAASGSFTVTVRLASTTWVVPGAAGDPLVLTAAMGRSIPVRLQAWLDGVEVVPPTGPGAFALAAPRLVAVAEPTGATPAAAAPAGASLTWRGGAWMAVLDTSTLAPGRWRIGVALDPVREHGPRGLRAGARQPTLTALARREHRAGCAGRPSGRDGRRLSSRG